MSLELVSPGEHLGTELALIWQDSGMERPLVDLNIGLGGECLVTVSAFEVSSSLMYDLHMSLQLHSAGQQLATHVTREEFLGHHLTLGVHSMLTRPEIRGSVICKKNQLSVNTCVQTETWPWHTLLDSIHS